MSKFNLMSLGFALAMCLFVGAGAYNYRINNVSLSDTSVPLASSNDNLKILINKDENVTDGYRITDKLEVKSVDGLTEEVTELRITLYDGGGATKISKTLTRDDKSGKEIVFTDSLDFRSSSEIEGCILMISYTYLKAGVSGTQSGSRTITDISLAPKAQELNMNDKPIFKFNVNSKTVLGRLQDVEVCANHSSTFTVTSVEAHLYQGGVEFAKNTDGGSRYTDNSTGRSYDGYSGYKTTLTVPGNLTPGGKVTIKAICKCVPSSGGKTYTFEDQVTCDYVGESNLPPEVNPYSNIKFLVNGSENPGTISVNSNFTASVQTSMSVYQIRVDLLDSNGNAYYTDSQYSSSLTISDLKTYTTNLSSLSNHKAEITLIDNNKNKYTHKVPFSLKDDTVVPNGQKGTFKITPSSAKEIKLDEEVSASYTRGNGEIIDSIKLELIDSSSGRTLLSNTNSGGGSNISKLDVAFAISRDVTSSNAKLVCTANTRDGNGNTYKWTETVSGFQVNLDGEPGKITVTALTPNRSTVNPGDSLRFAGHTDSASTLTNVEIEVYKGDKLFIKESKNMNTSNFEYIYKMPDNEYGEFTFYVTFSGKSKGLSMDPVTESYHYTVWDGQVKVTINSNIYDHSSYSVSDISGNSFKPSAWLEYVGNSSIKKFTYELKNSNKKILKTDTIKAGLFTSCEEDLTGVRDYLRGLSDASGDYVLTLTATDTDNREYKKDVNFSITTGDALIVFDINPSSSTVAEGSEISFTANSISEYLKSVEYQILNDENEICHQSQITASANSKTASGKVTVDFGTKRWTSKIFLSLKATDVRGNTTSFSVAYTVASSKSEITSTVIAKNKKTFKAGSKIDYKSGSDKVKVLLQNKKTNKTIETKTTKDGSLSLPSDEGTYTVKITKTDSSNNQIDEEYTYFAVSGDYIVDPNLKEPLSIDLWLKEEDRFYEKDKTIPLKVYYMNSGTNSSNLSIKLNLPEGVTISKCSDGTFKDGKLSLGSVPSDFMGVINLELSTKNLKEADKDFEINASILDGSNEKDWSSQEIFIYKDEVPSTSKGYLTGYPDGTIKPDNSITRGEVAAIFARAFELEENGKAKTFKDLKSTQWAYKYIQACAQNGIIEGYTDGTFKQGNNITVNELATMIYRVTGIPNNDPLIVTKKYEEKSTWEKNYIVGLERLNMLESLNTKDHAKNATRGDVIHLVNEALFLNPDSSFTSNFKDLPNNHVYKNDISIASGDFELVRTKDGKVKAK